MIWLLFCLVRQAVPVPVPELLCYTKQKGVWGGGASGMIRLLFCLVRQAVPVPVPGPPPSQPAANRHRQPGKKYIFNNQHLFIYLFISIYS